MDELKSCPFCGGTAQLEFASIGRGYMDRKGKFASQKAIFTVRCTDCNCQVFAYEEYTDAINAWNRRVDKGDNDE